MMTGDSISSDVAWNTARYIEPDVQLADGSYAGFFDIGLGRFDGNGNVRWIAGAYNSASMATADGGVIADDGTIFDANGNATGQVGTLPTFSWKGAYQFGSVESVAVPVPTLPQTFAAVSNGNLSGNATALVHHSIGLAWCGNGFSETGSCNEDPYNAGAADVSFSYVPNPTASNLSSAQDFSVAHPDWVSRIQSNAMKTLKSAFAQFPVTVQFSSWHATASGGKQRDQDHTVFVAGGWPSSGQTGEQLSLSASLAFYWTISAQAQIATGYPSGQGPDCGSNWCSLRPTYPPQTQSDLAVFQTLMTAMGTGTGNTAAHELGHQFAFPSLPYMDCGYDPTRQGGPLPCESDSGSGDPDNFVYNFFNGSGYPQDAPDSSGAQFKYIVVPGKPPIHWGPAELCAIKRNLLNNPSAPCN